MVPTEPKQSESASIRYQRQTRNAVVFMATLAGIITVLTIIGVIVAGIQLAKIANNGNSTGITSNSNCLSQGGLNPNC